MSAEVEAKIAARQQITNLPTIYITIPDINLNNISNELFKDRQTNTAEYHNATIKLVGGTGALEDFEDDVQIKVRGNSTADPQKRPYRLKFAKDEKDANGTVVKTHKHDCLEKDMRSAIGLCLQMLSTTRLSAMLSLITLDNM